MHIAAVATTAMRSDKNWNEVREWREKTNLADTCERSKPISQWEWELSYFKMLSAKTLFFARFIEKKWRKSIRRTQIEKKICN